MQGLLTLFAFSVLATAGLEIITYTIGEEVAVPTSLYIPGVTCSDGDDFCIANNNGWKPAAASYVASAMFTTDAFTRTEVVAAMSTAFPQSALDVATNLLNDAREKAYILSQVSFLPSDIASELADYITPALAIQATATGTPAAEGASIVTRSGSGRQIAIVTTRATFVPDAPKTTTHSSVSATKTSAPGSNSAMGSVRPDLSLLVMTAATLFTAEFAFGL